MAYLKTLAVAMPNDELMNNKLERMWKEATVSLFEMLPRQLSGWWSKTMRIRTLYSRFVARSFNLGPPEYEGSFYPPYRTV